MHIENSRNLIEMSVGVLFPGYSFSISYYQKFYMMCQHNMQLLLYVCVAVTYGLKSKVSMIQPNKRICCHGLYNEKLIANNRVEECGYQPVSFISANLL